MKSGVLVLTLLMIGSASAAPTKVQERQARVHYDRGMAKYALRDFEAAIAEFKSAYALTQAPGLLFNLGQASRLAKQPEEALHFYRTYLRLSPEAPNRKDVERFISVVEPMARAATVAPPAAAPVVEPPREEPVASTPERLPPPERAAPERTAPPPVVGPAPRSLSLLPAPKPRVAPPSGKAELGAGIALLGVGVAALGAGIAFGLSADSAAARIQDTANGGGAWSAELRNAWNDGQRDAAVATGLYVAGAATAITGAVLAGIGGARRAARSRWSLAPSVGGAQASWSYAF